MTRESDENTGRLDGLSAAMMVRATVGLTLVLMVYVVIYLVVETVGPWLEDLL